MSARIVVAALACGLVGENTSAETISKDRLCQAIGDTPNIAVPPRDRAFFQDRCECIRGVCAYIGSALHRRVKQIERCETDSNTRISEELGRSVRDGDSFSDSVVELCVKHASSKKVLGILKPRVQETKAREAAAAEEQRRIEAERSEQERLRREDELRRIEKARLEWEQTQERVRAHLASGAWQPAVAAALDVYMSCMGDTSRPNCSREAEFFWDTCHAKQGDAASKQADSRYCDAEYDKARAAQLSQRR